MADVHRAAFDDPRFEEERLRAAARAVLAPLEQARTDEELIPLWGECLGRWLPRGWRTWRMPLLGRLMRALQRGGPELWLTFMAQPGEGWKLSRADIGAAGEYHLAAETVPEPVYDPALHDAAIRELAEEGPVAGRGELSFATDAGATRPLHDLSLADARFAPDVVEAAVRSLIRAWRRFAIGDEDAYHAFAALSSYEIAEYARHADLPARLHAIDVVALVPSPPALFLRIAAVVQGRDGARDRILWWKLDLDDTLEQHWRLVDAYARPELRELSDQ